MNSTQFGLSITPGYKGAEKGGIRRLSSLSSEQFEWDFEFFDTPFFFYNFPPVVILRNTIDIGSRIMPFLKSAILLIIHLNAVEFTIFYPDTKSSMLKNARLPAHQNAEKNAFATMPNRIGFKRVELPG